MIRSRPVFAPRSRVEVFSLEPEAAQITWREMTPPVELRMDGRVVHVDDQPCGVATCDLRAPSIRLTVSDRTGEHLDTVVESPADLPGEELFRLGTISDLHFGATGFGLVKPVRDREDAIERCASAAVADAVAWGAELLIIKGDLTQTPDYDSLHRARVFIDEIPVPVVVMVGNHDVKVSRKVGRGRDNVAAFGLKRDPIQILDRSGVRLVTADTTIDGRGFGRLRHLIDELVDAVSVDRPVYLALHHHLQRTHLPHFWPPGVPKRQSDDVVAALLEANSRIFISSGHTHRHRRHDHGALAVTEVGSVKDYPGVWAGYRFHGAGVVQSVRRVSDASVVEWTERTRAAVGGVWPRWSPGGIDDRSFVHRWSPHGAVGQLDPSASSIRFNR